MDDLIRIATIELAAFLAKKLPDLSTDWWDTRVIESLSFQQQRMAEEREFSGLKDLDFAALIRVFDRNWYEVSLACKLPREGRNWLKELQTVRNRWAHWSAQEIAASEIYRDADTLGRVLEMIGAEPEKRLEVELVKSRALSSMTSKSGAPTTNTESVSADTTQKPVSPEAMPVTGAAPASKNLYAVGDLVVLRSDTSSRMPIIEVLSGGAECQYQVFQQNRKAVYYESQLDLAPQMHDEIERVNLETLHACLTGLQLLSPSTANLFSLRSGRVQFVPYQYRPVLKLIRADRPRLLIADEVGVGKTIEAGLIIKELRARMDISSVLIICPKALVSERKWFAEMKRFDEHFTHLDGKLLRHCLRETDLDGEWPDQYAKAIIPFSLFDSKLIFGDEAKNRRDNEGLLALEPPPKFDLVIVDEAHHIRNASTYLHQGVRYFCDNAQAAIFLTATPVQLGSEDLFILLNVLRPDLVIDKASFEQMAAPNASINHAIQHCRANKEGWEVEVLKSLDDVTRTQWGRLFLKEAPSFQAIYDVVKNEEIGDAERITLVRQLEELYTFSPMINRTRRRDIGEFTTRKPETLTIEFTSEQQVLHDDLLDVVARILEFCHGQQNVKFMMTTIRRQAASCLYGLAPLLKNILGGKLDALEMMQAGDIDVEPDIGFIERVRGDIEELLNKAEGLDRNDPKVAEFIRVLVDKSRMPNNKALVFSTFRHTLAYLAKHTAAAGLRFGQIHGDVPDEERFDLRRRFGLPKDDRNALDILLSSEVGCEGLDFQFCDLLVNYDLPWNPMRVEQRIGRIDRYGQKSETVAIVNLITPGTVDADIYERCLWRIGVFQHSVGGSEEILGQITKELHDIAESFSLSPEERAERLRQLGDNGIRIIQEEMELEEKQAQLFGLALPKQTWRQDIEDAETFWLSPSALQRCVARYLSDRIGEGGDFILGEKPLKHLRLNQGARARLLEDLERQPRSTDPVIRKWEKWLRGADHLLPITFDQITASENPEVIHFNVLHPLVRQAARFFERPSPIYVSVSVGTDAIPDGEYPFAVYCWRKVGVRLDETLHLETTAPLDGKSILSLLIDASDADVDPYFDDVTRRELEANHHAQWSTARANHVAANRELIQHRIESLKVSHTARMNLLNDQLETATNEKIRRMKESERARASQDYQRRMTALEQAAKSADIHSKVIAFGKLLVGSGPERIT